ncbi:MAG: hypothetical protein ACYC7L_11285 [Nitrospirota bacterium]
MNRLIIAIFSLSLILSMVRSEALSAGSKDDDIKDLYNNILVGEIFQSGNIYLERLSLSGGYDNQQHFESVNVAEEITIYPVKKTKWARVRASFSKLIKAKYIGDAEKQSRYFLYPFSEPIQDALLYKVEKELTDEPLVVISSNNYEIAQVVYFDGSDARKYSDIEYKAAMKYIRDDHERKDKFDATLSKITEANTILNARKIALFRINKLNCDVLLSVYMTHGVEYASTVYVVDFIKNGKIVLTKEKYNTDGPY